MTDETRVVTLLSVPFTDVLDRLPDEVDRDQLIEYFSGWTDFAYGTNSHTLVPWSVLADDITDCCIELGYGTPDINEIFPANLWVTWGLDENGNMIPTNTIFVDLEN
ncbi:MAG: hypothetical protein VW443_04765 [Pseudomonadales bacterium]|jgi:hypothetical protein